MVGETIQTGILPKDDNNGNASGLAGLEQAATTQLERDTLIELRDRRVQAGEAFGYDSGRHADRPSPPLVADPLPECVGRIPEIEADALDLPQLAGAVRHHGSLIVRGLMPHMLASAMRNDIDQVLDVADRFLETPKCAAELIQGAHEEDAALENAEWFSPLKIKSDHITGFEMVRKTGSVFTFLSPAASHKLVSFFDSIALKPLLTDYFGDEPCMSFLKSVLRRVEPLPHASEWHQDGAFMSEQIKSLNLWLALSDCGEGTNKPGMDLIPRRLNGILDETGQNDAIFKWSVSPKTIDEKFADTPPTRPHFAAGV